ncbi:MAG TPA: glycolate oxidase subunit GlcE [Burkholderiaceae bacterium]
MDRVLQQLKERIVSATVNKTALQLRGGGTKDWYGQQPTGEILDTRAYSGIIDYDPTELVITARCGTSLAEIENALNEHNQMLAFEPPHYGSTATIGGVVASGLSGPRRSAVGAVRDFMLGAVLMNGKGDVLHFGGQVMKNVAGYDVSRLLAGSLGTLGLILEVSLKVLPKPFVQSTRCFEMNQADAIHHLNAWGGQPLPISASAWIDGVLSVRLSGAQAAINAAEQKMGGIVLPNADIFWQTIREQTHDFFNGNEASLWRLSMPSVASVNAMPGLQLLEWGGAQRWLKTDADELSIRTIVEKVGGHATLFKGGDKSVGVFQPLSPVIATIHRKLKASFDPAGIFNPGRMYLDF